MTDQDNSKRSENIAGSPNTGEPVFLAVGKLRRPHALRGEMLMDVLTDFPERLQPGDVVYVGEGHQPIRIRSRRDHHHAMLIAFEGYDDPESIGVYRNHILYVRTDDRPGLPDGEFYHHQLLGMRIRSDEGKLLGTLSQILVTGANDVYIVRADTGPDILIPAIDQVVLDVNLDQGEILVHLLPGLTPD